MRRLVLALASWGAAAAPQQLGGLCLSRFDAASTRRCETTRNDEKKDDRHVSNFKFGWQNKNELLPTRHVWLLPLPCPALANAARSRGASLRRWSRHTPESARKAVWRKDHALTTWATRSGRLPLPRQSRRYPLGRREAAAAEVPSPKHVGHMQLELPAAKFWRWTFSSCCTPRSRWWPFGASSCHRTRSSLSCTVFAPFGAMFGVSEATTSRAWNTWLGPFAVVGRMLSNLPLNVEGVALLQPHDSPPAAAGVGLAIDGRDIRTATPRKDNFGTHHYSDKSKGSTVMGIAGTLLCGLPRGVTPLVLGRCSEMHLMERTPYVWRPLLASRHKVMADEGFRKLAQALPLGNPVVMPHFKVKGLREASFEGDQVDHNRGVARARWVVEAHFSRVAEFAMIDDDMRYCDLHMADSAWFLANGLAVMRKSFKQPRTDVSFPSLGAAWAWARAKTRKDNG